MQGECSTMTRGPVRPLENAAAMRATDHAAKAIAQKPCFFCPPPSERTRISGWRFLNPCSWIGLARRNYRLKLPVRQVQMPESEPTTWR
jgi:hypothetical protein